MTTINSKSWKSMGLAAAALIILATGPVWARGTRVKQDLSGTAVDANARGTVKLKLKGTSNGTFEVVVKKLDRDSVYDVIVGGVRVATLATSGGGNGKVRFRSLPRSSRDELLGFDPRGEHVTVRNEDGQDVLEGTLAEDGSPDDGDIICCIPDDDGEGSVECEDRTPAECSAAGGTATTATSCLPDPCGAVPPAGRDIVCCIPDDSGPECEDRTQAECTAAGGTVVEAASCDPNPCATTPPPTDEIVCCVPDDRGDECEVLTPARCTERNGTASTATSCLPDPCAGATASADDHGGNSGSGARPRSDDGSGHR